MDRKEIVRAYFEGFRQQDHAAILSLLTDDVRWDLAGFRNLVGKAAFDDEIGNAAFDGRPTLVIDTLVAEGDHVVAIGTGVAPLADDGGQFRFAYCDAFTFRGPLIERVESLVVPLDQSTLPGA